MLKRLPLNYFMSVCSTLKSVINNIKTESSFTIIALLFTEYDVARNSRVLHWNFSIPRATSYSVTSQATVQTAQELNETRKYISILCALISGKLEVHPLNKSKFEQQYWQKKTYQKPKILIKRKEKKEKKKKKKKKKNKIIRRRVESNHVRICSNKSY